MQPLIFKRSKVKTIPQVTYKMKKLALRGIHEHQIMLLRKMSSISGSKAFQRDLTKISYFFDLPRLCKLSVSEWLLRVFPAYPTPNHQRVQRTLEIPPSSVGHINPLATPTNPRLKTKKGGKRSTQGLVPIKSILIQKRFHSLLMAFYILTSPLH